MVKYVSFLVFYHLVMALFRDHKTTTERSKMHTRYSVAVVVAFLKKFNDMN